MKLPGAGEALILEADRYSRSLKTEIRWAWDDQFLFLAARCVRPPGTPRVDESDQRQRDVDLSENDRIVIRLDIDRDYSTHWKLTVDHRGWANDALNYDASWNPNWFIDSVSTDQSWTVEAAIPWDQIAPETPRPGDVWAIGIDRIIPGLGAQGWGEPQERQVERNDVGLLIFE